MNKKILIVNALEYGPEYEALDYPNDVGQWFIDAFGGDAGGYAVWRVQREESPPPIAVQAVAIGGSLSSVYDEDAWIRRLETQVLRWIDNNVPLLGVCFGHQLIARVLGGRVERNPQGWELGTRTIELTEQGRSDPLFDGLTHVFSAMQTHQDAVIELPPGAESLAASSLCTYQSFRVGDRIRTIQFHPEFTPGHVRYLLSPWKDELMEQGYDIVPVLSELRDTPDARRIFINFKRFFIKSSNDSLYRTVE